MTLLYLCICVLRAAVHKSGWPAIFVSHMTPDFYNKPDELEEYLFFLYSLEWLCDGIRQRLVGYTYKTIYIFFTDSFL